MWNNIIFDIFYGITSFIKTWSLVIFCVAVVIAFVFSLVRYISAKRANKKAPETYTIEEIESRKTFLIAMSIIFGLILLIFVGFAGLMMMALAHM